MELKGYSERNLSYMLRFANEYPDAAILQQAVAKLPWGHNILLAVPFRERDVENQLNLNDDEIKL